MSAATLGMTPPPKHPLNLGGQDFAKNKYRYYQWLRAEAPVYKGKISVLSVYCLSHYHDCVALLKDPRFVRNRTTATGGRRLPIPLPKSVSFVAKSMIIEDEPEHLRLRTLVNKAFAPRAVARFEPRIERLTHDLIDQAQKQGTVDLLQAYSLPVPTTVIAELVGVSGEDEKRLRGCMRVLSKGFSGWSILRTMVWDLRRASRFVRELIARKRANPREDVLTGLIHAEEEGERLSEDELVSMVFLLIIAGYETTAHLITNGVATLLQHPDQLARLRDEPELIDSAVEEILRFRGPVQGTKLNYALEDVPLHGVTIPRGSGVVPLFGAANHDPAVFEEPEVFDITRTPNRHLGFGHGIHFCLGAHLARMETRISLTNLLARNPNLRLAVKPEELRLQNLPLWHRYQSLPVVMG